MKWCIFVKCLATCLAHSRYLPGVFVNNTPVGIPVLLHNEKMEERTSNPSWYLLLVEVPFFWVFNCLTMLSWFLPCITMNQPSDQIRSVTQSCPTLCDPMNRSTPGLPVHHQLPEFTETHVHRVSDAIQPFHPPSSPSPPAPNPSQHQSLFQ